MSAPGRIASVGPPAGAGSPDARTGEPPGLNRYAYVYNNPLRYNDPSGHFAQVLGGFLLGAGLTYGNQVLSNLQAGMTIDQALIQVDVGRIAAGGRIGAVGAATFGASLAVLGAATGVNVSTASASAVGVAMAAGVIAGRAEQVTANLLKGQAWAEGAWDPSAMALDAVTAGTLPALRPLRGQVAPFVEGRIQRHLRDVVAELRQEPALRDAWSSQIGAKIHQEVAERMIRERIPGLWIEHGRRPFRREEWPVPRFQRPDRLNPRQGWLVEYSQEDSGAGIPIREIYCDADDLVGLPEDGVYGFEALEIALTHILSGAAG